MATEIKVPPFPESVEEGTLTSWYKQPGDTVARDEKVADIETDKIVLEVSAPAAGTLGDHQVAEGENVKPGRVLASVEAGGGKEEKSTSKEEAAEKEKSDATKSAKEPEPDEAKPATPAPQKEEDDSEPAAEDAKDGSDEEASSGTPKKTSPVVRRLIEEHDLDPEKITGSGRGGMITKADVMRHLEEDNEAEAESETASSEPSRPVEAGPEPGPPPGSRQAGQTPAASASERPEKRVAMTRIRARIAERLVEAQRTAAILTTFNEVNLQPVMDLRARHKSTFEKAHGVKLGFMSFFVKAAVQALRQFPVVNATLDGSDIIYHGYYDIGVAVSTERGLVVPIIRDADQLSYAAIEQKIAAYAQRARDGQLTMEDLTGGTFSITNGGIFGSLLSTPILNPPQSAILGMHQIQQRPVAEAGQVVIRPMMYTALSYDHRIIDGREAVQFLVTIKQLLEEPARILLEV